VATGTAMMTPAIAVGTMPDWSADGLTVVYSKGSGGLPGLPIGNPGVSGASLEVVSPPNWGTSTTLVPFDGQLNNFYPTFSPDNAWVLFNRASGDSFDNAGATLWVVPAAGGSPLRLASADLGGGNSWPKWAPFVHTFQGNRLMWFTFSSRRGYGLRQPAGTSQIWMAAFNPSEGRLLDPSYPALWFPFQELATGNHIPQWVTTVARPPCTDASECGAGEFCTMGMCLPGPD
jgi:TolB protein